MTSVDAGPRPTTGPALEVRNLTKLFNGVVALDHVDLTLDAGRVHGLLGENGSGKSTLIKILSGFHQPDAGTLTVWGQPVSFPLAPDRPAALGLRFVHQDLGFVPGLTVAENFHLGSLATGRTGWRTSSRELERSAAAVLEGYGIAIDTQQPLRTLSSIQKTLLAVVRAMHDLPPGQGILVLDEPTVFLPRKDVEDLFTLIRRVAAEGSAVLLVSHDLEEVTEITHQVSVLRDARLVGSRMTGTSSKEDLVHMIVGRAVDGPTRPLPSPSGAPVLDVVGLTGRDIRDVSFSVAAGEIVGVTGLEGSGAEELPYLLYGAHAALRGQVSIGGRPLEARRLSPTGSLAAGMALIPADRRRLAGLVRMSVEENLTHPRIRRFRLGPFLRRSALRRDAESLIRRFDVRPPRPAQTFGTLSGGNQQKAVLAKWLAVEPKVLLLHEPTQGVDVGARQQILDYLRAAASDGRAVICASSDFEQLAALCNRVLVFRRGQLAAELTGASLDKKSITRASLTDTLVPLELTP
jgi:ribose transport system ATP-binding protein